MQQGMELFARLVRMLLGQSAIADRKLDCGLKVTILGIDVYTIVCIGWLFSALCYFIGQVCCVSSGVRFTLNKEKAVKWLEQIKTAIAEQHLDAGASQKLSGRLAWSTQFLFNRSVGICVVSCLSDHHSL